MKAKYLKDYIDELHIYFPQIEKKELKRIVEDITTRTSFYLRKFQRGFSIRSKDSFTGSQAKIVMARIFGKHHLKNMQKGYKNRFNLDKDGKQIE